MDQDRWYVAKRWLDMLPAEIKLQRPGLLLAQAWITVFQQQYGELTPLIARLESLLDGHKAEPQYIQGLGFFHGLIHYWQGNSESTSCCSKR